MNYYDFTSKIFGFPTSRCEDKVTATKIRGSTLTKTLLRDQRVYDTHTDPPEGVFESGLIMLFSIVLFCATMVICYNARRSMSNGSRSS